MAVTVGGMGGWLLGLPHETVPQRSPLLRPPEEAAHVSTSPHLWGWHQPIRFPVGSDGAPRTCPSRRDGGPDPDWAYWYGEHLAGKIDAFIGFSPEVEVIAE